MSKFRRFLELKQMAIITFAKTMTEFLSGTKTVTRRAWADRTVAMWQKAWDEGRHVHDAYDKTARAGGKPIGKLKLMARPYLEKLADMPEEDLEAEGGMCATIEEYYDVIDKRPEDVICVVWFEKVDLRRTG